MSRDKILAAIRRNKPEEAPLPQIPPFAAKGELLPAFINMVESGGGQVIQATPDAGLAELIKQLFPAAENIASPLPAAAGNIGLAALESPAKLEAVDLAVIAAQLGVAENGALWVSEQDCGQRVLPFITQHLAVLLNPAAIVANMHEAYRRIQVDATGFGLFIAGPSKTADIEQSLVIGAQGARSLTVILGQFRK